MKTKKMFIVLICSMLFMNGCASTKTENNDLKYKNKVDAEKRIENIKKEQDLLQCLLHIQEVL